MDFIKGACLQIQKSANIMYVAGAFRRNRGSNKYIEGVNGNSLFVFIAKIAAFLINIKVVFNILYLKVHLYVFLIQLKHSLIVFDDIIKI